MDTPATPFSISAGMETPDPVALKPMKTAETSSRPPETSTEDTLEVELASQDAAQELEEYESTTAINRLVQMPPPKDPIPKREWKEDRVGVVRPCDRSHPGWLLVPRAPIPPPKPGPATTVNRLTEQQARLLALAEATVPSGVTINNNTKKQRP